MFDPSARRRSLFRSMMRRRNCSRISSYRPRSRTSLRSIRFTATLLVDAEAVGARERDGGMQHLAPVGLRDAQPGEWTIADHDVGRVLGDLFRQPPGVPRSLFV